MYLAEIHGKLSRQNENMEDILTSNVFSFFKYAPRQTFLFAFLLELSLDVTPEDALSAEFLFWPTYANKTEPDLVIVVGRYYLLFEAKYHSGFGEETARTKHQLVREIEGGVLEAASQDKIFKIIAVTAHYYLDSEIFQAVPENLRPDLIWINWQRIALLIFEAIERHPDLPAEILLFASDLYRLLLKKNLRYYEGPRVLSAVSALHSPGEAIFFNASTAVYRGDFIGFAQALEDLPRLAVTTDQIFFSPPVKYVAEAAPTRPPRQEFIRPPGDLFDNLRCLTPRLIDSTAPLFFGGTTWKRLN